MTNSLSDKVLFATGAARGLCKAIVEAHSGEIWARSEPGKGTTFFVALPIEHAQSPVSNP